MKKIISVIITFILLFSCLGLTAFANPASASISDDYQKLYIDGNSYSRFNTSMMNVEYFSYDFPVELSATQKESLDEIILQANEDATLICAKIIFKDGAVLTVEFLRDDYLELYNEITVGETATYTIDFHYPEGNTVTTKKEALYGNGILLGADKLEWCDYFPVIAESSDGRLSVYKGSLIIFEENYYYVDFKEAGIESWYEFDPYECAKLPAYEISDPELISSIQKAEDTYYSDDLGFFFDDSFTEAISLVFLIIVFAIVPFVIFVLFLILAIRSKTVYKKMFRIIYMLSAAELVVFAIVATFVNIG